MSILWITVDGNVDVVDTTHFQTCFWNVFGGFFKYTLEAYNKINITFCFVHYHLYCTQKKVYCTRHCLMQFHFSLYNEMI